MVQAVKAVYPGSFDPPTLGHIDVIERAAKVFSHVTVLVAKSSMKNALFTFAERQELLIRALSHLKNVSVDTHDGLTVDYVRKVGGQVIIRGLRAVSDFEYELQMATINRKLYPEVETMVIMAGEKFYYITSTMVKEVALHGGDVSKLVPPPVNESIRAKRSRG